MTDKTKEAIKDIVLDLGVVKISCTEAFSKICDLVDEERKGEVVLATFIGGPETDLFVRKVGARKHLGVARLSGKKGRLVFIPEEEK